MLLGKRNEKQAESTAHEVDALIGGVVIVEQVIAKVRTETCPLFVEGIAAYTAAKLWWRGFQPFGSGIEEDTIERKPPLRVRTKTCPLFAVGVSGIIASHVRTERAPVVSSSSKRHSLCQRSCVFPNRGNR